MACFLSSSTVTKRVAGKRKTAKTGPLPGHPKFNSQHEDDRQDHSYATLITPSNPLSRRSDLIIPSYLSKSGQLVPSRQVNPLSGDHLLPLIEYNVYRAILTNLFILGHTQLIGTSCGYQETVPLFPSTHTSVNLPESMKPTSLQQSVVAYPQWIDLLPSPQMRDNAILTQHQFTNFELSRDILGGLAGGDPSRGGGMIAWSDPWNPSGWELREDFLRKWWFLFVDCHDLLQSTNRWRSLRGERPLRLTTKQT